MVALSFLFSLPVMVRWTHPLLNCVTLLLVSGVTVTLLLCDSVTNIPRDLVTCLLLVTEEVTHREALLAPGHLQPGLANLIRNILADDVSDGEALLLCDRGTFC